MLSVLLRLTETDYPFGIFKLFLELVSDTCLTQNEQLSTYIMARKSNIQCNDDDPRFLSDQHA